jgi:hypothetical protein
MRGLNCSVQSVRAAQDVPALDTSSVLQPERGAAPAGQLATAADEWRAADGFYFRGIARLQRLWEVR